MSIKVGLPDVTFNALCKITEIDREFVGSPDYMGVAQFWDWQHPQKTRLSRASVSARRKIHAALVKDGLDLNGDTGIHRSIISTVLDEERQGL
jgi:hypothetical protein